jgi:hypothetical protein
MHITLTFDKNSSRWERDYELNKLFIRTQLTFIQDLYETRGYIYLDTIYDLFGLRWNPYEENICWILERDGELELSTLLLDRSCNEIGIGIDIVHN